MGIFLCLSDLDLDDLLDRLNEIFDDDAHSIAMLLMGTPMGES